MKLKILAAALIIFSTVFAQNTESDGDWTQQFVTLKGTPEADYMIRIGDIDNLSYGWPADFNPFSGRSTYSHDWPFNINPEDAVGTDRVMIPSSYVKDPNRGGGCSSDGYSGGDHNTFKAVPLQMPLESLQNAEIKSAALLMFVDDFQSPSICSRFRVWFNGKRFSAVEKILDGIDQTGPIGKIIYAKLPAELLPELKKDKLTISIDDSTTYAADGFAIDFIKLLINPKPYSFTGTLKVIVRSSVDSSPIKNAAVVVPDFGETNTNPEGQAQIKKLPAGLVIADFSAKGFISKTQSFDVIANEEPREYEVFLDPLETVTVEIEGQTLMEG